MKINVPCGGAVPTEERQIGAMDVHPPRGSWAQRPQRNSYTLKTRSKRAISATLNRYTNNAKDFERNTIRQILLTPIEREITTTFQLFANVQNHMLSNVYSERHWV